MKLEWHATYSGKGAVTDSARVIIEEWANFHRLHLFSRGNCVRPFDVTVRRDTMSECKALAEKLLAVLEVDV